MGPMSRSSHVLLVLSAIVLAALPAGAAASLDRHVPVSVTRSTTVGQRAPGLTGSLAITWFSYTPAPSNKANQAIYQKYQHLHPGVTFTFPPEPNGALDVEVAWTTTRAIAHRLPDIYGPGDATIVNGTVQHNWWVDLTPYLNQPNPYVPGNKHWRDMFLPGFLDQGRYYDSKRNFLIAADGCSPVLYVNKAIFQRVGAKIPTTWAELLNASQKIKKAGYYAFDTPNSSGWPIRQISLLLQDQLWAGTFVKAGPPSVLSEHDFLLAVKQHKISMTDARTAAAWQLLKQWMPTWYPGTLTANNLQPFLSGKVAMYYDGTWDTPRVLAALGANADIVPFPTVTPASSPYAIGDTATGAQAFSCGNPVAISTDAARRGNLKLAIDFLRYFSQPSVVGPAAEAGGLLPMVKGASLGTGQAGELAQKVLNEQVLRPSLTAAVQLPAEYFSKQESLCDAYLSGALDLHTVLGQMQSVLQTLVNQLSPQAGI